jgi:hypothetical protein
MIRRFTICAIASQLICAIGYAQNPDYGNRALIIPAGTTFEGRIDARIGSSVSHTGDHFHIVMASPVLANGNTVLIPVGSRIDGEVVEAIPASHVYRAHGASKPKGKLRVQLTMLEMPNGAAFPMVASLVGEGFGTAQHHTDNPNLGKGVGYVGSAAGFNAVTPTSQYAIVGRSIKPQLVSRDQMLHDPLYGVGPTQPQGGYNSHPVYRSLEQHGNNLVIERDSPLSVKLDAALKIPLDAIMQTAPTMNESTKSPPPPASTPTPMPAAPPETPETTPGDAGF